MALPLLEPATDGVSEMDIGNMYDRLCDSCQWNTGVKEKSADFQVQNSKQTEIALQSNDGGDIMLIRY